MSSRQAEFRLLPVTIGTAHLRKQLEAAPELWNENPERTAHPASPHREADDIWVRFNSRDQIGPRFSDEHRSVWYPSAAKLPAIRPIAFHLMAAVEGVELGGILITRLMDGGMVYPHTDHGWHAEYYSKFYLPVKTAPGDLFRFQSGDISPQYGQVWEFDNSCRHWVDNQSGRDRMALIICIRTHERERRCPHFQTGFRSSQESSRTIQG